MSDGKLYSPDPIEQNWPSLVVSERGAVTIGRYPQLPDDARQVVSGVWQIVTDGQISTPPDTGQSTAGKPAPHTVAGIDRAGSTLILLVVDGRRPDYSLGMGRHRMAEEMLARNAWNAIVLDGGGSTTLVLRDLHGNADVINRPSDGYQLPLPLSIPRCVANALGVIVDGAPTAPIKP
jgi:exopolysaccharide biosynthesis protein